MTVRRFESSYSDDEALNRVQKSLEDSIGFLKNVELLDGKLIETVVTTYGDEIAHGLGRPYKGVLVVKISLSDGSAFTGVVRESVSSDPSRYVKMASTSGSPNVSLWVF